MSEPKITTIVYQSGTHATEKSWDVMQVIGKYENGLNAISYVLALAPDGTILRRTDVLLERWEIITDKDDLRIFRKHFADRDRLRAEEAAKAAGA